eukprot:m.563023 g.563023  ORF g.563023 m.563023 type:complete len:259 (-) comp57809_c0_seq11:25-801(-)
MRRDCFQDLCFTCKLPKNMPAHRCMWGRAQNLQCRRCEAYGHVEAMCTDLWRQYHDVVDAASLKSGRSYDNGRYGQRVGRRSFCANCGGRDHFAFKCPHIERDVTYPFVAKYTAIKDMAYKKEKEERYELHKHGHKHSERDEPEPADENGSTSSASKSSRTESSKPAKVKKEKRRAKDKSESKRAKKTSVDEEEEEDYEQIDEPLEETSSYQAKRPKKSQASSNIAGKKSPKQPSSRFDVSLSHLTLDCSALIRILLG